MIRRPPCTTRTDTLFPYTTLFRSPDVTAQGILGAIGEEYESLGIEEVVQTSVSQGTSFEAPIVSGIVAMMLEANPELRSEEHTSELQSLMRISYADFCLKKTTKVINTTHN